MTPVRVRGLRAVGGERIMGARFPGQVAKAAALLLAGVLTVLLAGCGSGGGTSGPNTPTATTPLPPPVAKISTTPADRTAEVSPVEPVKVTVTEGKLVQVGITNPDGITVAGKTASDGLSWQSTEPLGYGKTYTVNAIAEGTDKRQVISMTTFTTVKPRTVTFPSMNPLDGQTVGIGQPIAIYFDEPIADKDAAEDAITVRTTPPVNGAFYWYSDKEVHWRPQQFWPAGTQVDVDMKVYGRDLGAGVYGQEDRSVHFQIGDAFIARADGANHRMTVELNGRVVRTMDISMGGSDFPSNNGVHVVTERHETKLMDSTTFGLALDAGGYQTKVKWATRISNGGEFVHSAPWSVAQQGNSNVSHGCINLSPENAKWFFDNVKKGDVVINTNTGGPDLEPWDGFGDWQIPWSEWITGGRP